MSDTSPSAARILLEGYRSMTPQQRLDRVVELNRMLDEVIEGVIRSQHEGELSEDDLLRFSALRRLDPELVEWAMEARTRIRSAKNSDATE
ncbi:MAG: hypothetical protein ACC655_10640 [Rhodothermia bacterium]